jgi:hypothetical protein
MSSKVPGIDVERPATSCARFSAPAEVETVVHCFVIPAEHPWSQGTVTTSFRVRRFRC